MSNNKSLQRSIGRYSYAARYSFAATVLHYTGAVELNHSASSEM
jgi:hypothetical protein